MLEIQEKFSSEGYEELISFAEGVELHITEALDKGEVTGFIAYAYENDRTVVYDYDDGGDLMLCDGLVRSVIFKSCLKGIETAEFRLMDKERYDNLRKLRFIPENSNIAENIDSFMNGCQNCKNNNQ
ncbi:MAG: hypothetical protein J6A30_06285 [Ruminococcus sp.]|nr:hypothetical protein [Ruminococcus sp.]MBP3310537.1 hypothetical protein [Ruminococcus sp.]